MGVQEGHEQPSVQARLQLVRNIARSLNSANNAIALYPADSPMPKEAAAGFVAVLDRFLMFEPYLQLAVSNDQLCLEDEDVCGTSGTVRRLAFHLHARQVGQIRFLQGLDAEECVKFLRVLAIDPDALRQKGGLAKALVAGGIEHIRVVDLAQEAAAASGGQVQEDSTHVSGVAGLREEALISRDATEARAWLRQAADTVAAQGLATPETANELARILAVEAGNAEAYGGAERELGLDNLAQAIGGLDDRTRHSLIGALMTSTDAAAEALQSLLARVNDDELVTALAETAGAQGRSPAELLAGSRLDPQRRDRVAGKANALMRPSVQPEAPAPAPQPRPAPVPRVAAQSDLPRYSRKTDNVAFSATRLAADVRQFTQEERDGLMAAPRDAQAQDAERQMIALLYLLGRASDEAASSQTMDSVVETGLYALDMGRIPTLTRGLCGIRLAAEHFEPGSPVAVKLDRALAALSAPDVAAKVVQLLDGEVGEVMLTDATAYFASAQPAAQEAAIDVLGTDISNDLKTRLQTMLKDLGPRAIGTLERHVTDSRWTVAYSSVVILGGIGEPRMAPALRRALGHSEPRVAEAAMRSLAAIGGSEAEQAIVWAIQNADGPARSLAIESAGKMHASLAVRPLESIATSGDLFGRTLNEKLAVVDALGAIGSADAVRALEEVEHTRFFFSPGKTAQLRDRVRNILARAEKQPAAQPAPQAQQQPAPQASQVRQPPPPEGGDGT